ncbi:MAG: glycosyltransferase family 2 protein [Chitinophagaceae bacterium]|nr:MAG: glycosyltransferase family 2 protein [Chitinophagaceae bacterium]
MEAISVVILTKDAAATIDKVVKAAKQIATDIVVMDSGSTDETITILEQNNIKAHHTEWLGYGATRNKGAKIALHDFILNLDADEVLSKELIANIRKLVLQNHTVIGFERVNFLGRKKVKFGEWGSDISYRLYNKIITKWNLDEVHETIDFTEVDKKIVMGELYHFTTPSIELYRQKMSHYAQLSAEKYMAKGKKISKLKMYFSPCFSFIKHYFFGLGFLDGIVGWQIATAHFRYVYLKYAIYFQLQKKQSKINHTA